MNRMMKTGKREMLEMPLLINSLKVSLESLPCKASTHQPLVCLFIGSDDEDDRRNQRDRDRGRREAEKEVDHDHDSEEETIYIGNFDNNGQLICTDG